VITHFDLTGDPDAYIHRYFFHDNTRNKLFTKSAEIDILEIGKLPAEWDGTPLWLWGDFFRVETREEFEMLAEKNEEIGKAVTIIKRLSGDARARRLAEMEELARMDEAANRRAAYNEGVEEGIEKGNEEGYGRAKAESLAEKLESAAKLLKAGVPPEVVSQSLGIPSGELGGLRG
jgi:predicted transposase/invertase (TIGR01784 family)